MLALEKKRDINQRDSNKRFDDNYFVIQGIACPMRKHGTNQAFTGSILMELMRAHQNPYRKTVEIEDIIKLYGEYLVVTVAHSFLFPSSTTNSLDLQL